MARLLKYLMLAALIAGAVYGTSYVGARATAGKLIGPSAPDLGTRQTRFFFEGVKQLPGNPRAWLIAYGPTEIPGAQSIKIYISPTGRVIRTYPHDLEQRMDLYRAVF